MNPPPPLSELPIPAARHALTVFHPAAPVLRVRYRDGVVVGGLGFPVWTPYARAVVRLPDVPRGRGRDEMRALDVLCGNEALAGAGSGRDVAGAAGPPVGVTGPGLGAAGPPVGMAASGLGAAGSGLGVAGSGLGAAGPPPAGPDRATPPGWAWVHEGGTRRLLLVPADLHASFVHAGGVSTMDADRSRRGIDGGREPVGEHGSASLSEAALARVEKALGFALPAAYRAFLRATNGGRPSVPAVHPRFGFVADQPLFGLARDDWMTDLVYASGWFGDRLTADFLAIGHVQGGQLALRVRGEDTGSVWYLDDDDHRDADTFDASYRCAHLLHRVADDFAAFWAQLRAVPHWMRVLARDLVAAGAVSLVDEPGAGASLPRNLRT